MKSSRPSARAAAIAGLVACCSLLALFVSTASAIAPVQIEFREPEKGTTFAYVDQVPKTTITRGQPKLISAGDQIAITKPVFENGQRVGHLQAYCTATKTSKDFFAASFECLGTYVLKNGTMVVPTVFSKGGTNEGSVLGGTGAYANARGTFTTTEHKGFSITVVSLVE